MGRQQKHANALELLQVAEHHVMSQCTGLKKRCVMQFHSTYTSFPALKKFCLMDYQGKCTMLGVTSLLDHRIKMAGGAQ